MSDKTFYLEVAKGIDGFKQIEAAWQAMAEQHADHFSQFPTWHLANMSSNRTDPQPYFICVRSSLDNSLQAVIPLHYKANHFKYSSAPILQLYYDNEMGICNGLTIPGIKIDLHRFTRLLEKITPPFVLIRWQSVLVHCHLAEALSLTPALRVTHHSKFLFIGAGFEAFWSEYSKKFRKGLEKKAQQINQLGQLRLTQYSGHQVSDEVYSRFLELENSGWKGDGGTSISAQNSKREYYDILKTQFAEQGRLRINILYLNDRPIAAQFGVVVAKKLYLLKIAFNEEYKQYSPGHLILYSLVKSNDPHRDITHISFVTGVTWIDRWHPKLDAVGIAYTANGSLYSKLFIWALQFAIKFRSWAITLKSRHSL